MSKGYNGEVIHFSGGINDYIGELDQSEHPMGPNWYRIKNACVTFQHQHPETQRIEQVISYVSNNKSFRKFVDVRVPDDSIVEVKVVDKDGHLYKVYKAEIARMPSTIIHMPNSGITTGAN
jgi:hypothetical protein